MPQVYLVLTKAYNDVPLFKLTEKHTVYDQTLIIGSLKKIFLKDKTLRLIERGVSGLVEFFLTKKTFDRLYLS